MGDTLTHADRLSLSRCLAALGQAGFTLADGIEPDDVEDALSDDLPGFRSLPVSVLVGARDPDGTPMIPARSLEGLAQACCGVAGVRLREFVAFPDPGSPSRGSLRLRVGDWDVVDVDYDLARPDAPVRAARRFEAAARRAHDG